MPVSQRAIALGAIAGLAVVCVAMWPRESPTPHRLYRSSYQWNQISPLSVNNTQADFDKQLIDMVNGTLDDQGRVVLRSLLDRCRKHGVVVAYDNAQIFMHLAKTTWLQWFRDAGCLSAKLVSLPTGNDANSEQLWFMPFQGPDPDEVEARWTFPKHAILWDSEQKVRAKRYDAMPADAEYLIAGFSPGWFIKHREELPFPVFFLPLTWFVPLKPGLPPPIKARGGMVGIGARTKRRIPLLDKVPGLNWAEFSEMWVLLRPLAEGNTLINIHSYPDEYQMLETHRLTQPELWGACIVTETCNDPQLCDLLKDFGILADVAAVEDMAGVVKRMAAPDAPPCTWRAVPNPTVVSLDDLVPVE